MVDNRVRLYGKKVSKWMHEDERGRNVCYQFEMEYKEYSVENGTLVGEGTEDFSTERYRQEIITKLVWTWDGKKRNKEDTVGLNFMVTWNLQNEIKNLF